jgi:hypothetical protein
MTPWHSNYDLRLTAEKAVKMASGLTALAVAKSLRLEAHQAGGSREAGALGLGLAYHGSLDHSG